VGNLEAIRSQSDEQARQIAPVMALTSIPQIDEDLNDMA
jgi:hypothetical protein